MTDRFSIVRGTVAGGLLASIALSLPLWQTHDSYPRVPFFDFIPAFPAPLDTFFLVAVAIVLGVVAWRPNYRRLAALWFFAAIVLVLQDQSRLQAWLVEYALLLAAVVFSKSRTLALNACRLILATVYFWSGVHKMNTSFAAKLFPWLISPLVNPGLSSSVQVVGWIVPFLEIGMSIALLVPTIRRLGVIAIVLMHLFLLAMLSPLALGWNGVVMPWNVTMIVLVPSLFWNSQVSTRLILVPSERNFAYGIVLLFVTVLPLLGLAGFWDTNPSFALYSGNQMIGSVVLSSAVWEQQDKRTQAVAELIGDRYRIRIDDWSVATTNVPAYPAERVLRRVARSFCTFRKNENDIVFILEQPPRWLYRSGWHRIEDAEELCR